MRSACAEGGALREYAADLHVHSVLSPCADLKMSPTAVVRQARQMGLSLVALTDHNAAWNAPALRDAAEEAGFHALYGMEVRSQEEVDVLCLFDDLEVTLAWGRELYPALPDIPNDPLLFGDQVIVDREERILRMEARLLINAVEIPLRAVAQETAARGGLAIPAHVDRPVNSLISQLGFPPEGCPFDAMEVSPFGKVEEMRVRHPWLRGFPLVRFSDAHALEEVGRQRTWFRVGAPRVREIRMALRGEEGRSFR